MLFNPLFLRPPRHDFAHLLRYVVNDRHFCADVARGQRHNLKALPVEAAWLCGCDGFVNQRDDFSRRFRRQDIFQQGIIGKQPTKTLQHVQLFLRLFNQ